MTAIALHPPGRREVRGLALAAIVAGVVGTVASLVADRGALPPLAGDVAPESVLAREPYMGVRCPGPGVIECDRVGLAVWLKRPARSVSATIAGRPLRLDDPHWSAPPYGGDRTMFAGFLERAGIRDRLHVTQPGEHYWGIEPPAPVVELRIAYADGRVTQTTLLIRLRPDWS
jgi:hypothetical protein